MCGCGDANDAGAKKTETKPAACAGCEAAKASSVKWEKQPGATDEDMEKAKKMWEDAKKRRLPDGSKPKTVQAMEALEKSDKTTTIKVGPKGNSAAADNWDDAKDPTKGSGSTILFNPNKTGTLSDGVARDPESSLAHEATHSYHLSQGQFVDRQTEEVKTTGAENEHRAAKGIPQRQKYGAWDVPQYTPPAK